ncbi:MAG TPA: glutamine-hydrolyzing GMP synthase [Candidatus Polarisedimenticolia bacterium]|nr:glutamine-hydrolyzing GMP synthase [Candidatus Polarisedimenticolia bacterium]
MSGAGGATPERATIVVLDFGSQLSQLIARRVREIEVYSELHPCNIPIDRLRALRPKAIILSGGPDSVYAPGAPHVDPAIFGLGVPVLGICYGMQAMAHALEGRVERVPEREFGPATLEVTVPNPLFAGLPARQKVWMSHGDQIVEPPAGFTVSARTPTTACAAMSDEKRRIHGILFHPEVTHTEHGRAILEAFVRRVAGCPATWRTAGFVEEAVTRVRATVGDGRVIAGLSGGVDSAVAALLIDRAIGDRLQCLFVDNGLLRQNEGDEVEQAFRDRFHLPVRRVDAAAAFLEALAGVVDPEEKRRVIGRVFVEVFEREATRLGPVDFLAQGTLYPDLIESTSVKGPSAVIKTHHNVGGLPAGMRLRLVEPLRELFKDEVRRTGLLLGLDAGFVGRHPFPGPGLAVRILGEVTRERLDLLRRADALFIDALRAHGLYDATAQAFVVLLPVKSVGVMGDGRTYENVAALRAVTSDDFMTADWARLPHDFLAEVSARIVNEVRGINRVVYDVSSKPPATIEWE